MFHGVDWQSSVKVVVILLLMQRMGRVRSFVKTLLSIPILNKSLALSTRIPLITTQPITTQPCDVLILPSDDPAQSGREREAFRIGQGACPV